MSEQPRDAERTRTAILNAARHLFAERGIKSVSIRNIAAAAGVSHGLIQQYFGTRENMVAGIIKHEIDTFMSAHSQVSSEAAWSGAEQLRNDLKAGLERFRDFALIIMRAELAGIEPEKMIDPAVATPAMLMASVIANTQGECGPHERATMDPKLVSAFINAALFGFATMAPWLMTSVGLKPDDYEKRSEEIVDITTAFIRLARGQNVCE